MPGTPQDSWEFASVVEMPLKCQPNREEITRIRPPFGQKCHANPTWKVLTIALHPEELRRNWAAVAPHGVHILSSVGMSVANVSITGAPVAASASRE
jgi:hypothetical protein